MTSHTLLPIHHQPRRAPPGHSYRGKSPLNFAGKGHPQVGCQLELRLATGAPTLIGATVPVLSREVSGRSRALFAPMGRADAWSEDAQGQPAATLASYGHP